MHLRIFEMYLFLLGKSHPSSITPWFSVGAWTHRWVGSPIFHAHACVFDVIDILVSAHAHYYVSWCLLYVYLQMHLHGPCVLINMLQTTVIANEAPPPPPPPPRRWAVQVYLCWLLQLRKSLCHPQWRGNSLTEYAWKEDVQKWIHLYPFMFKRSIFLLAFEFEYGLYFESTSLIWNADLLYHHVFDLPGSQLKVYIPTTWCCFLHTAGWFFSPAVKKPQPDPTGSSGLGNLFLCSIHPPKFDSKSSEKMMLAKNYPILEIRYDSGCIFRRF